MHRIPSSGFGRWSGLRPVIQPSQAPAHHTLASRFAFPPDRRAFAGFLPPCRAVRPQRILHIEHTIRNSRQAGPRDHQRSGTSSWTTSKTEPAYGRWTDVGFRCKSSYGLQVRPITAPVTQRKRHRKSHHHSKSLRPFPLGFTGLLPIFLAVATARLYPAAGCSATGFSQPPSTSQHRDRPAASNTPRPA